MLTVIIISIVIIIIASAVLIAVVFMKKSDGGVSQKTGKKDRFNTDEWNEKNDEMFKSSPIKVLVIEDNPGVSRSIAEMLMIKDIYVKMARNGLDAMSLLLKEQFDLVTTGLNMPGMNGINFLNSIKNEFPRMKKAVISACTDEQLMNRAKEAGAFKCLKKPFLMSEVYDLVNEAAMDLGIPLKLKK